MLKELLVYYGKITLCYNLYTLPINMIMCRDSSDVSLMDKIIVTVCCALCNCCESVVPLSDCILKHIVTVYQGG
jgi:hypothetical protein